MKFCFTVVAIVFLIKQNKALPKSYLVETKETAAVKGESNDYWGGALIPKKKATANKPAAGEAPCEPKSNSPESSKGKGTSKDYWGGALIPKKKKLAATKPGASKSLSEHSDDPCKPEAAVEGAAAAEPKAEPEIPEVESCFPGTSMVMLDGGRKRSMDELRIGDKIMTIENLNLKPTRVLGFLDKKVNQTAPYINLILEDNRSLFISSRHVMFIKGDNNAIQSILAKDVSLGDIVIVDDGKKIGFVPIRDITVKLKKGAYVPLTHTGTLLVDGVLVSSYTNTDHWLAHIALSPLRWWPTLLLDTERSQNLEGVRSFPRLMRNLGRILGLVTMADRKMETLQNPVLRMSQMTIEKMDKAEF